MEDLNDRINAKNPQEDRASEEEISVEVVLEMIKNGSFDPSGISKEARGELIDYCHCKGYDGVYIARLLQISVKTVYRHLEIMREKNAISVNYAWVQQMVGEVTKNFRQHYLSLKRLTEEAEGKEKARLESLAWKVQKEYAGIIKSLGVSTLVGRREMRLDLPVPAEKDESEK